MAICILTAILATFVFTCSANVLSSASKSTSPIYSSISLEKCDIVKDQFNKDNLNLPDAFPTSPYHDSDVKICYDGKTHHHQKSCCSRSHELSYKKTAQTDFTKELKWKNIELKKILEEKYNTFHAKFLLMIKIAENRTDIILDSVHSVAADDRRPVLRKFFKDVEQYFRGNTDNIETPVNTFFSEIFPLVFYKKDITDRTVMRLTEEYKKCLIDARPTLYPAPFGLIPFGIMSGLKYTFSITKSFLQSLKLAINALDVAENLIVDESCLSGLTKMHFCSTCQGHLTVKPCRGLCLNVMRGCMSKMMEFGAEWDELISSLKVLSLRMKGPSGLQEYLREFEGKISEALMHALSTQHRYYDKVTSSEHCGPPDMVTTSNTPTNTDNLTLKRPGPITDIYEDIRSFVDGVVSYHGWTSKISDKVCNNSDVYEQSLKSGDCWNGKHVSLYNEQIPDPYFISQVKYNPEVTVSRKHDPSIASLKTDLTKFRESISRHMRPLHMIQGDEPPYSGDGYRENTYRHKSYWVTKDDAAYDQEGSASGSGDQESGSGSDVDGETQTEKKGENPVYKFTTPRGDFGFTNNPTIIDKGDKHGGPGGAATSLHSYIPLYILTLLPILLVRYHR